jgi:hypothetical protein
MVADDLFSPRRASPCVLTYRGGGVPNDLGIVSGVNNSPDRTDGGGGVLVGSNGAPGDSGQALETRPLMPMHCSGSNRASAGEQLWSPDSPALKLKGQARLLSMGITTYPILAVLMLPIG